MADYTESAGFYMQSASRRGKGNINPDTQIRKDAASLLEQMRIDQKVLRTSLDAREMANARIQAQAAHQKLAAYTMWTALVKGNSGGPSPPPAFYFSPVATAPVMRLDLSAAHSVPLHAEPSHHRASAGRTSASPSPSGTSMPAAADRPQWNASTLLREDTAPRALDGIPTFKTRTPAEPVPVEVVLAGSARGGSVKRPPADAPSAGSAATPQRKSTAPPRPLPTADAGVVEPPAITARRSPMSIRQDCERERAVRDYLLRMNICGHAEPASGSDWSDEPLLDALYNGAALCQLAQCLFATESLAGDDPVPVRRPTSLAEVQLNYTAALGTISDAASRSETSPPRNAFRITPSDVYLHGSPTTLLELYVHLISEHLPSPDMLPSSDAPHLSWQPPADAAVLEVIDAAAVREAEQRCCALLFLCGVLPDPATYDLPPDDCLIPAVLSAPFVADRKNFVSRTEAPPALCVPSVFPYLTNGVALCTLCRRSGVAAELAAAPAWNPKTRAGCIRNITLALTAFHSILNLSQQSMTVVAAEIYRGNRRCIVGILDSISAALGCTGSDAHPAAQTPIPSPAKSGGLPRSTRRTPSSTRKQHVDPSAAQMSAARAIPSGKDAAASPSSASALLTTIDISFTAKETQQLEHWAATVLGQNFSYGAEDGSFAHQAGDCIAQDPQSLIFSDGVVLAHMIRVLECRRCEGLDCVQPTSKRPAKRFNIKRCLTFLQKEKGVLLPLPLLDELLLAGDTKAVLSMLRCLKTKYKSS